MYSKVTEELLTTTVTDYYAYLAKTGYMRYDKVCGILALAFVNRFLNSHLSVFVTEDDYRLLSRFLYTVIGRDCLIPWPEYTKQLPQTGGAVRDDIIPLRIDEGGLFRYVQKTPNPRTDDTSYTFWAPVPFRLYASPEGSEISINGESVDMVMCVPGDKVEWEVSKEGYVTQTGSERVLRPTMHSVRLEEYVIKTVISLRIPFSEIEESDVTTDNIGTLELDSVYYGAKYTYGQPEASGLRLETTSESPFEYDTFITLDCTQMVENIIEEGEGKTCTVVVAGIFMNDTGSGGTRKEIELKGTSVKVVVTQDGVTSDYEV